MSELKKPSLEERRARAAELGRIAGEKTSKGQKKVLDKTIKVTTAASKRVADETAKRVRKATGAEKYQQEAIQLNERLETALQNLIIILDEKEKEIALLRQRVKDLEKGR
ncbi:MAG: hypothetical protein WCG49_10925 [Actinomycetes bacterium]